MGFICPKITFPQLYVQLQKNLIQILSLFRISKEKIVKDILPETWGKTKS